MYFESGRVHDGSAPHSIDPEGKYRFGYNLPRMIDVLDESEAKLGVTKPSRFVWGNPLDDEGELDKLTDAELEKLKSMCEATKFWVPIELGIITGFLNAVPVGSLALEDPAAA